MSRSCSIAYERYESPWAISIILGADLLPAMLLGPIFGAFADRWSRRWCAIAADLLRLIAFIGIAVVGSFEATVAFAVMAGVGTALFTPATVAGLASVSGEKRLPAATALYGAASDLRIYARTGGGRGLASCCSVQNPDGGQRSYLRYLRRGAVEALMGSGTCGLGCASHDPPAAGSSRTHVTVFV